MGAEQKQRCSFFSSCIDASGEETTPDLAFAFQAEGAR